MSKKCIYCGAELHDRAVFCHSCANSQIEKQRLVPPRVGWKRPVAAAGCVLLVFLLLFLINAVIDARSITEQPHASQSSGPEVSSSSIPAGEPLSMEEPSPSGSAAISDSPSLPAEEEPAITPEPSAEPEPSATSEPPITPEPSNSPEPSRGPEPTNYESSNGELLYADEDGAYRLILTFYRSDGEIPPMQHEEERRLQAWQIEATYSQLFVAEAETGVAANEVFLQKVSSFELDVISLSDGAIIETEGPLTNEEDPLALRSALVYYNSVSGSNLLRWTITMKNGDVLTLQHILTITEQRRPSENRTERLLTDDQLAELKQADIDTLQTAISTVADAVAYLDLFGERFYDSLDSDFLLDIEHMLSVHRSEATGTDVYTAFTGWCLADDYPDAKYLIAAGDSGSFNWVYHGLLLPVEGGYKVISPAAYSSRWNSVRGYDEVAASSLDGIVEHLALRHDGMTDDSGLPIYHLYAADVGVSAGLNFYLDGNYLLTSSDAVELYRQ